MSKYSRRIANNECEPFRLLLLTYTSCRHVSGRMQRGVDHVLSNIRCDAIVELLGNLCDLGTVDLPGQINDLGRRLVATFDCRRLGLNRSFTASFAHELSSAHPINPRRAFGTWKSERIVQSKVSLLLFPLKHLLETAQNVPCDVRTSFVVTNDDDEAPHVASELRVQHAGKKMVPFLAHDCTESPRILCDATKSMSSCGHALGEPGRAAHEQSDMHFDLFLGWRRRRPRVVRRLYGKSVRHHSDPRRFIAVLLEQTNDDVSLGEHC
mmetsp:Transcript_22773/g.71354  ORF Transcript_22773/g.71354 Transcript_22773/m.71354 type:complete len:267 (-) Transcript_22773:1496-2296(-)